ncbi:hypothetical protein THAOC_13874, partial [Thalassiosira oceanica]
GVRCRVGGKDTKIIQHPNGQLILEKNVVGNNEGGRPQDESKGAKNKVVIRNVNDKSYALTLLRAAYGLIAVFMGGFLFIVGLDILLFLFIDLGTKLGLSSVEGEGLDVGAFILTLLSVPVFVYSLAMGMTLVTKFVIDTFNGHPFLMSFGFGRVATEWLAFVMYLGIPACIFIVTLFIGSPDFWEISIMGWFWMRAWILVILLGVLHLFRSVCLPSHHGGRGRDRHELDPPPVAKFSERGRYQNDALSA